MADLNQAASTFGIKYDTENLPLHSRREWMSNMIAREFTRAEISVPSNVQLRDQTTIYPWEQLRLSTAYSRGIQIDRLKMDPYNVSQDSYLLVLLLSGRYLLEQNGREVFLQPGEMTIYDATQPHRIHCPEDFSKVIITIPRKVMRERLSGVELCTARKVSNKAGVGLLTSNFISSIVHQLDAIDMATFSDLSECVLDSVTLALASVRPQNYVLSRSRSLSLHQVKGFIAQHLADPNLNPNMVAKAIGLSPRYINMLFDDESTSLMRYVLTRRLKHCYDDLSKAKYQRVSDVAFRWGFNDVSHFSRAFKQAFDATPTDILNING